MTGNTGITLTRFIIERQARYSGASGEFSTLLSQIATAAKIIAHEMRRGGLAGIRGLTGEINVQGEAVRKMDEFANSVFLSVMEYSQLICEVVSEEMAGATRMGRPSAGRRYSLLLDPLDGSSNIDINGTVGTIFSIQRRRDEMMDQTPEEFLLIKGSDQLGAGYVMYGPSTILVYTTGDGVHAFTLEPGIGEFILSDENIRMPKSGKTYAINVGNRAKWFPWTRRYIDYLSESDATSGQPNSLRYVGALVADFHRTLLEGGLYVYPGDEKNPQGKLRLTYECAPLAFVAEQAGGRASTGEQRILEIQPANLHQRSPLIIGSADDVALAEQFCQERR
jgi:fructose-1,6-bisphosphatase I